MKNIQAWRWLRRAVTERAVLQYLGLYLAGGWGMLEFESWAVEHGHLAEGVPDVFFLLWLTGLPVVAFLGYRFGGPSPAPPRSGGGAARRSVAVLPFSDSTPGEGCGFLGEGLAEEIIATLVRVPGLRVASRTSSFRFRNGTADVRTIGQDLGVEAVLEGSVRRLGDRLRVSVQLADARTGYDLWSERWDASMDDVFNIQDSIARNVTRVLEVILTAGSGPALRRMHTQDVGAFEAYLRGRRFLAQTGRRSLGFARVMFRRAIELDPTYALAHAALCDTACREAMYYPAARVDLGDADLASRRALELAPHLAEAHSARGSYLFLEGRYEEAEDEFATALDLEPTLFDAHYMGARMAFQRGQLAAAAQGFERALENREDYQAAFFAAQAYEALGQRENADEAYARALQTATRHMELNPDDARAATMRAVSLCRLDQRAEGLRWGARALEIDPSDAGIRYNVACLYAVAGEPDAALEELAGALERGFGNRDWLAQDPDLTALRDDPRFLALMRDRPNQA